MLVEIKVPSVGESVTEAILAQWFKNDGDAVAKDEPLFVLETDKVTLEVVAEADGILSITVAEGETIAIGAVVGILETGAVQPAAAEKKPAAKKQAPTLPAQPDNAEKKPAPEKKVLAAKAAPGPAEKLPAAPQPEAAELLELSPRALRYKIRDYGLE